MEKKGQVDTQFNWVFALVAGALILSLIGGFIFRQQQISQDRTNENNLRDFQGIISALKLTEERVETFPLDSRVSFGVDYKSNTLIMGKAQAEITTDVVAAPRSLGGRELYVWTKPAMLPAHITNIVFLSPSTRHYVFVGDIDDLEVMEFYESFPGSINKMMATVSGLDATVRNILKRSDAKIRIVYVNMPIQNKASLAPKRISEIGLDFDSGNVDFGGKSYLLYCNSNIKSVMPQIAVLVDNGDDYAISISRIFDRSEKVYEILRLRADNLKDSYEGDCQDIFSRAVNIFDSLKNPTNLMLYHPQITSLYREAETKGCANLY